MAGVDLPDSEGFVVSAVARSAEGCIGEADRRDGGSSLRVDVSCSLRSATVVEGSNGLPSMIS